MVSALPSRHSLKNRSLSLLLLLLLLALGHSEAQTAVGMIGLGNGPSGVAIDPVWNKVYVTNSNSNTLTAIDGVTQRVSTIALATSPQAIAINPATHEVIVVSPESSVVTIVDEKTNQVSHSISVGRFPAAISVNSTTNRIYIANRDDATVSEINGTTWAVSTFIVGSSPVALALNPATNRLYVADRGSNELTVIDVAAGTTANLTVGSEPSGIAINPITNIIYVANEGDSSLSIVDGASNAIQRISVGSAPSSVAVSTTANRVYVSAGSDRTVSVLDGVTNSLTSIPMDLNPGAIGIDDLRGRIYVANLSGQTNSGGNVVAVLDARTDAVSLIKGIGGASAIAVNPITDRIYVPNTATNSALVISGGLDQTSSIGIGKQPGAAAINPVNGDLLIANSGGNSVTVLNSSDQIVSSIPISGSPLAIAVNPVTRLAYVASYFSTEMSVIDTVQNKVIGTRKVGSGPDAVAVDPARDKIFVANGAGNDISVLDGTGSGSQSVKVGDHPIAFALDVARGKIYVLNNASATVTAIDESTLAAREISLQENNPELGLISLNSIAYNAVTNKVYVGTGDNTVRVIDGETGEVKAVRLSPVAGQGVSVGVNVLTDRTYATAYVPGTIGILDGINSDQLLTSISLDGLTNGYTDSTIVADLGLNQVYASVASLNQIIVIDGSTNFSHTVPTGGTPQQVLINPLSGKVYATDRTSDQVTIVSPGPLQTIPITTTISGASPAESPDSSGIIESTTAAPVFSATVTSLFAPPSNASTFPKASALYYQIDTSGGQWTAARAAAVNGTNSEFTLCTQNLSIGLHLLYYVPMYGGETSGATSGQNAGTSIFTGNIGMAAFLVLPDATEGSGTDTSCASTPTPPDGPSGPLATDITLASSSNPQTAGLQVRFSATVKSSGATAVPFEGNVDFFDGGTRIGTTAVTSGGTASLATSTLSAGHHPISASFNGSNNLSPSTSTVLDQSIVEPPPITGDFRLAVTPASLKLARGNKVETIADISSLDGYQGNVLLSCSQVPSNLSCLIQQPSVTLTSGSSQNVRITLEAQRLAANSSMVGANAFAGFLFLPGFAACFLAARRTGNIVHGHVRRLLPAFIILALFAMTGCGVTFNGLPEDHQVVLTGTSADGKHVHSTTIVVTVTP